MTLLLPDYDDHYDDPTLEIGVIGGPSPIPAVRM